MSRQRLPKGNPWLETTVVDMERRGYRARDYRPDLGAVIINGNGDIMTIFATKIVRLGDHLQKESVQ
jgi:hypothetical protein